MAQLITSAQTLTNSWADLGSLQETTKHTRTAIWLNVDINDSENVQIRALAKEAKNADNEYSLPIKIVGATETKIAENYYEINVDADQKVLFEVQTSGLVPFVQWQVKAGTVGATPGQIDEADVTYSNY